MDMRQGEGGELIPCRIGFDPSILLYILFLDAVLI
jgi:hypothetical protein